MGYELPAAKLDDFLRRLRRLGGLVAPLKRDDGVTVFQAVEHDDDLARLDLDTLPPFPAKKFLQPPTEELFSYDMATQQLTERHVEQQQRILFGLRLCDLNAIRITDRLFRTPKYTDDHYAAARDQLLLVGWYCNEPPGEHCFCGSMELENYYDLLLRPLPGTQLIHVDVGSPRGELLLRRAGLKLKERHDPVPPITTTKQLATRDLRRFFDDERWTRVADEQCLSCQRCTLLCPTCLCFDIYDTTKEDLRHGTRVRTWDSCHNKEFTQVAGKHVFRPGRDARFKHRIYHKLVYYEEAFGTPMCTGCGRCIEHCPAQIDFVEHINELEQEAARRA